MRGVCERLRNLPCGPFAAALFQRSDAVVVGFERDAYPLNAFRKDSLYAIARQWSHAGGGTDLSSSVLYAKRNRIRFRTGVFISDNESWADHLARKRGIADEWASVGAADKKGYFLQLVPYGTVQMPSEQPDMHYVYDWSDAVLNYMSLKAYGKHRIKRLRLAPRRAQLSLQLS